MKKTIWSCWFQGRQNAPPLVRKCLSSWERQNPGWEFRCLDATTVERYIPVRDHIDLNRQSLQAASLSNIVRILLLRDFGGVWVDATLFCNRPLDDWLPPLMGAGFFAFAAPAPDRPLSSWFLSAETDNHLVSAWCRRTLEYWSDRPSSDDYHWFHHLFRDLCRTDRVAADAWSRVIRVNAYGPHSMQFRGRMHRPAAAVRKSIDWTTPVFKLVHELPDGTVKLGSLLEYLLERDGDCVGATMPTDRAAMPALPALGPIAPKSVLLPARRRLYGRLSNYLYTAPPRLIAWQKRSGTLLRKLTDRANVYFRSKAGRSTKRQFVSYPKSGRTWIRYILFELDCESSIDFHHDRFEFSDGRKPPHDLRLSKRLAQYAETEKLVYLERDPRDVMLSLYHQIAGRRRDVYAYRGNLSEFIRDDYFGAENLKGFRRMWDATVERRGFLKISYETCHSDTKGTLRRILDYYDMQVSESRLTDAVAKASFANMKETEVSATFPEPWLRFRNGAPKMRCGKIGSYCEAFSEADIKFLNEIFGMPPDEGPSGKSRALP